MPHVVALLLAAAAPAANPDLGGFDYRTFIRDHVGLVADGKAGEATDHLVARMRPRPTADGADDTKRKFAAIYARAGKSDGHELAGARRLSARLWAIHAVWHTERGPVVFTYLFQADAAGAWHLLSFKFSETTDVLEQGTPIRPIDPPAAPAK